MSAVIFSLFVLYVIPNLKPNVVNLTVLFLGAAIITDCVALYLAGKRTWHILIPAFLVVILIGLLFAFSPLG